MTSSPPADRNTNPRPNERPPSKVVAVLGLGAMGARIAARLHDAGADVVVWNRSARPVRDFVEARPVAVAATPRAAAVGADIVISMVTDDDASTSVWLDPETGALAAVRGGVAVEMSTVTPGQAMRLAAEAERRHVRFLEAPVVGSRPQAESGSLVILAGGDPVVLETVRPVLDVVAGTVHLVGQTGSASIFKLSINGLFASQVASFAEILTLVETSEIDTETAHRVVSSLPITSPAMLRILGLFQDSDHRPNFPIRLVAKDLDYLCGYADAQGSDLAITAEVAAVFGRAARSPAADLDISGVMTVLSASTETDQTRYKKGPR